MDAANAEHAFWQKAMKGLPWFRWFRRPVPVEELDARLQGMLKSEWESLRAKIQPGDKIWPFEIHVRRYLGMRKGFVVVRRGEPIGGIVTISS
jgi:hypothetical protein